MSADTLDSLAREWEEPSIGYHEAGARAWLVRWIEGDASTRGFYEFPSMVGDLRLRTGRFIDRERTKRGR